MFYDNINRRCEELGISVSKLLLDVGMSKSTATKWKDSTYDPSNATKKKIADYFKITVAELMDDNVIKKEKPTADNGNELSEKDAYFMKLVKQLTPDQRKIIEDLALTLHNEK